MCNLSYGIRVEGREEGHAEGIAVGKAEGIEIGKMNNLYELASKGLLTMQIAAQEAGQTEEEFSAGMASWAAAMK